MKKTLGIVGGMGPLATVELFRLIVENTKSEDDAGHIRIVIDNNPKIPDRTASIIGDGQSPVPMIVESANNLKRIGADFILIPCNTSHYYYDILQENIEIPVINMVEETAKEINRIGYKKVGILATSGTMAGRVYEKYLQTFDVELVRPSSEQQISVMDFIYNGVKAGNKQYDKNTFANVIDDLINRGAQAIILACTEINIGLRIYGITIKDNIEPMKILARTAIIKAGYSLV